MKESPFLLTNQRLLFALSCTTNQWFRFQIDWYCLSYVRLTNVNKTHSLSNRDACQNNDSCALIFVRTNKWRKPRNIPGYNKGRLETSLGRGHRKKICVLDTKKIHAQRSSELFIWWLQQGKYIQRYKTVALLTGLLSTISREFTALQPRSLSSEFR